MDRKKHMKGRLSKSLLVARRCTAITFPQNEKEVVVADRTGDVYRFSLIDTDSDGELILGHLSMILDVVISSDDKYIITCDRDEKVRISYYPNAYNIQAFCLLHTEYVSQVLYLKDFNCIVSGSGDGTLACWTMEGKNLCNTDIATKNSLQDQGETISSDNTDVAVVTDNSSKGEGQKEVEGQTDPPGVKKIIYNQGLNVIAVIYHRSKKLSFFSTEKHTNGCTLLENSHNALTEEPWDICFDDNHRMWILQPCEQKPVLVYECSRDGEGKIQLDDCISDDSVLQTQNVLRDKWSFLQASLDSQKQQISLQKVRTYENVQRYLEKKEERINSQKNKQQSPPQKKLKTS
ncbi:tRNA (guanine-N(7)-)-methyltransferase non-catalytic subunit wdr4-like isoform X2 [Mercenaria mercenaria]|uniref:tRNA (guanine-N(7)-)-methyltransferase non-catalytic subunit wdr4-like isoform X2 n=1 Tax=Mercenaria mercenaria TaxID=6596 RepID=UPI00234F5A47|nr:tRNA (guanine-N(7)-)-methyltransferase non-catalytic subunit wdr4-like isoform X2 [Mercenaria mercenaria]